ncbi:MAG: hypothetical protein KGI93_03530 [Acidobacteriota bacterium]|nr:hypothetical protein [Acidobacteriota bacterium]MDE3190039.1 hypothetical protein [Acidobacteriota bacterium]
METTTQRTGRMPEDRCIARWRYRCLLAAGYGRRKAAEIAERRDIDLHLAVSLLEHGCPAQTALDILL